MPQLIHQGTRLIDQAYPAPPGTLVAVYQHSVFTQGRSCGIDSFDQWGLELGKVFAGRIAPEPEADAEFVHDSSTNVLIRCHRKLKKI